MKKTILILCIAILLFSLVGCGEVKEKISESDKFTEEEIRQSIDCTKIYFDENFKECTLKKIWYDEEKSDSNVESYLSHGTGLEDGATSENTITLLTNFYVSKSRTGALQPGEDYVEFMFTLIRDSDTGSWRVTECGYP